MLRTVIKEIDIPRHENPHGFGTKHELECGHIFIDVDHDPVHYNQGDEVWCHECDKGKRPCTCQ